MVGKAGDDTPVKRQKVSGTIVETAQITDPRVATVPMISIKSTQPLNLVISAGDKLSVANEGSQDVSCDHKDYLGLTRHVLVSRDMSWDHKTCIGVA